ncbi:MAG: hypothetical protein ABSB80_11645 [Methanoregula sp.]|jgi:hypothetical protein|uniref:hypothetical protein n=1 Tax=Methanoregula sp. TaxID=2052170 RepID=UPI003D105519
MRKQTNALYKEWRRPFSRRLFTLIPGGYGPGHFWIREEREIGYLRAAGIAREAMEKWRAVRDLAVEKGILSADEADSLFELKKLPENGTGRTARVRKARKPCTSGSGARFS